MQQIERDCFSVAKRRSIYIYDVSISGFTRRSIYIYDVSISGFTRRSIYMYDISSLRVNSGSTIQAFSAKLPTDE